MGKWKQAGEYNKVLELTGFYISYNDFLNETALVKVYSSRRKFYILDGYHGSEYEKLSELGYKACKAYFTKNKKNCVNFWSD